MPYFVRPPSRCSLLCEIDFHWFDGIVSDSEALDRSVEALMVVLRQPHRLWNPYAEAMVKSEFKKRIRKGAAGELKPIDEVKGVGEAYQQPLYEIRWQGIPVTERETPQSAIVYGNILVRLYHSEPAAAPGFFIGHHIHQKVVDDGADIYADQDAEIAVARGLYDLGEPIRWHLSP